MQQVTDNFLLNMAEVSGALVGLFLVGVFYFVETGLGRLDASRHVLEPYFRAGTRIVLVLFAMSLLLSLTLVVLEPVLNTLLFALLSLTLVAANIDTAVRIRAVTRVTRSTALLANEIVGTMGVLAIVALPWILGGLHPTRGRPDVANPPVVRSSFHQRLRAVGVRHLQVRGDRSGKGTVITYPPRFRDGCAETLASRARRARMPPVG